MIALKTRRYTDRYTEWKHVKSFKTEREVKRWIKEHGEEGKVFYKWGRRQS